MLAVLLAWGMAARADMTGTAHDFRPRDWSQGELCGVCHTPHNANAEVRAPLWNRQVSTASYTLYSSPTLDATVRQPEHYGSKLCLSCHDGTVALDSFGGHDGTTIIEGQARVGTDLRGTHPIGLLYDPALAIADGDLHNPDTTTTDLGGTIAADLLFGTGNLECASCHDVHNARSAGNDHLLRITVDGSQLCLTCHDK
jgi:predicted CXXCH cytochrome family protein